LGGGLSPRLRKAFDKTLAARWAQGAIALAFGRNFAQALIE
jgi:hypothetical protein